MCLIVFRWLTVITVAKIFRKVTFFFFCFSIPLFGYFIKCCHPTLSRNVHYKGNKPGTMINQSVALNSSKPVFYLKLDLNTN